MKLFGAPFIRKDYATLPKLLKMMTKELDKQGYYIRKDINGGYIVSSDRADLMVINLRVYNRSFDMWVDGAYGSLLMPKKTYHGINWREYMKRTMRRIVSLLNTTSVKDGHTINHRWSQFMKELALPDEYTSIVVNPVAEGVKSV